MRPIYHSNCERSPFYLLFIFSVCINIVLVMRVKYWRKKTGISNFSGENRNEVDSSALVLSIELHQNQYRRIYPWRIIQMSSNILFHYHFRIFQQRGKIQFSFSANNTWISKTEQTSFLFHSDTVSHKFVWLLARI